MQFIELNTLVLISIKLKMTNDTKLTQILPGFLR